jgi:transposase
MVDMRLAMPEQDRERLQRLARGAKNARLLRRAQALLDLDAGDSPGVVARRYLVTRSTIYNWINRYLTRGLSDDALNDLPRPGRPPTRRDKRRCQRRQGDRPS